MTSFRTIAAPRGAASVPVRRRRERTRRRWPVLRITTLAVATMMLYAGNVGANLSLALSADTSIAGDVVAPAVAPTPAIWLIDTDGDGVGDLAHPTGGAIRGVDAYGSGRFGASRGKRKHHGVDYVAMVGEIVRAPIGGVVTRIGFAYGDDAQLRFIEVRNPVSGRHAKVLYVAPDVLEGDVVAAGAAIGHAQDLAPRYPHGITNHVHMEITDAHGKRLDASLLMPEATGALAASGGGVRG